ncbi:MAG: SpoIIE family protein phosphatase [Acidobacteriia bacterium]|nr:SpoIIE family protein phosphatase [Terriglobia bacterium]
MGDALNTFLREQLEHRRDRLESALNQFGRAGQLAQLLQEVDSALERMDQGTYGLCEACHEPVEADRLMADPLIRFCISHLTTEQQRALEQDLELASRTQASLLPKPHVVQDGWELCYHYAPLGPVSGDYVDVLTAGADGGNLFFLLGDVVGKGVAASMLMAHIHATIRTLISLHRRVDELVEQANRLFCESTLAAYFATLVCGRASHNGEVELSNAGHCPPLVVRGGQVERTEPTGLPIGLFSNSQYSARRVSLGKGETLFLFTDGLTEARSHSGEEYGESRLTDLLAARHGLSPQALAAACLEDVNAFLAGAPRADDLTIMVLRRQD